MAAAGGGHSESHVYGRRAKELVVELKNADSVTSYNEEAVRSVFAETHALAAEAETLTTLSEEDPVYVAPLQVFGEAVARNRRCLIAYHHKRCDLIDEARWAHGSVLRPEVKEKMNSAEVDYFKGYNDLLSKFMTASNIDIMSDLKPPKENYVEVIALRDCGRLYTMTGPRDVSKDEVHFVRKYDAEALLRYGWLKHVTETA